MYMFKGVTKTRNGQRNGKRNGTEKNKSKYKENDKFDHLNLLYIIRRGLREHPFTLRRGGGAMFFLEVDVPLVHQID